jgi:hypothetical protein
MDAGDKLIAEEKGMFARDLRVAAPIGNPHSLTSEYGCM